MKVLICYYSTYGNVYKMANLVAEGVSQVAGAEPVVRTVPELIKLARESPTPLTYSTPGVGLMQHLSIEFMKQRFGFEMTHVPYRNTPQSVSDIAAELNLSVKTVSTHKAHVFEKMRLANQAELIRYAIRHRLADDSAAPD